MKNKYMITIICLFAFVILLVILIPNINKDYIKSHLYINEIMASNYRTIKDNYGEYSDYIEIYNETNSKINLEGYFLSDSEYQTDKWKFPSIEINPKDYLIVYASGIDECIENICHTNFKLSSKGETITLSDKDGNILSKFTYPELYQDISFGYKNGKYIMFETSTPGKENNSKKLKVNNSTNHSIQINEYMTHNTRTYYDSHGNYYDFVELYNYGDKKIELNNLYISDDEKDLKKYKLPSVEIDKDSYLIIYFSKEKVDYDDGIYAPFGLSDNDKYIIISNGDKIIDKVEIVILDDNVSYGRVGEEFKYFTTPTPGRVNDTAFFKKIGGNNGSS